MHARRDRAEQSLTPAMAAGAVATLSSAVSATAPDRNADAGHLTVLLHAAPLRMRGAVLQPSDIQRITGSLMALLERLPARSVRLVVFNLDQQKELLRLDDFAASAIDSVTKVLNNLQVATVDYKVLGNPRGGPAMLSGILTEELRDARSGDAVVVLGPDAHTRAQRPAAGVERPADSAGRLVYLLCLPRPGPRPLDSAADGGRGRGGRGGGGGGPRLSDGAAAGAGGRGGVPGRGGPNGPPGMGGSGPPPPPDTIQTIVKRLKGAVLTVRTPQDFVRAVARLNRPER
jgi:hypothetical protein